MAADHPDQGDQHEIRKHAPGAQDQRAAQAHDVAQPQNEPDGVESDHHLGLLGQGAHDGRELEIQIFLPGVEGGDQKIVHAGDGGGLQQQPGLRAALLAGDQHLGDGGCFGIRKNAVHVAHEIAAQGDEKQHPQASARQADEDGLYGMRVELQQVQRRQREHRARYH